MNKHIPYYISTLLLCLPMFFGCSEEIPYGERYEQLSSVDPKRHILIEDFTGQNCMNCPDAHKAINDLKALYGDYVIAVAIHAGHFAIAEGSNSKIVGLMQPEGNDYADSWGITEYPRGIINRTSGKLMPTQWAAYARQALAKESPMIIAITTEIDNGKILIHSELHSNTNLNAKLQLWITESNITAFQLNGDTPDNNYLHHHVYRAAVNGVGGEGVSLTNNIPSTYEHSIALRSNWNANNLSVVAFVYTETDGVIEVVEQHLQNTNI